MKKFALILALTVTIFTGCAKKAPPPPPSYFDHTVTYQGETLGMIANWYTGSTNNWNAIVAANPELKPNKLRLGTVIHIPSELVQQTQPLPKKLLKTKAPEVKKEVEPAKDKEPSVTPETPKDIASLETADSSAANEATPAPIATEAAPQAAVEAPTAQPQDAQPAPTSVVISTPSANDKVKEDLLDEILNPKIEPTK